MEKKKFLIIGVGITILVIIILIALLLPQKGSVNIITDKTEYKLGDILKVKIENNSGKTICFSSCYPYIFERKNGEWESYHYVDCLDKDVTKICVGPKKIKAFELSVPFLLIEKESHRLAIPACIGCNFNEEFRENQKLYSNDFIIK